MISIRSWEDLDRHWAKYAPNSRKSGCRTRVEGDPDRVPYRLYPTGIGNAVRFDGGTDPDHQIGAANHRWRPRGPSPGVVGADTEPLPRGRLDLDGGIDPSVPGGGEDQPTPGLIPRRIRPPEPAEVAGPNVHPQRFADRRRHHHDVGLRTQERLDLPGRNRSSSNGQHSSAAKRQV